MKHSMSIANITDDFTLFMRLLNIINEDLEWEMWQLLEQYWKMEEA